MRSPNIKRKRWMMMNERTPFGNSKRAFDVI